MLWQIIAIAEPASATDQVHAYIFFILSENRQQTSKAATYSHFKALSNYHFIRSVI